MGVYNNNKKINLDVAYRHIAKKQTHKIAKERLLYETWKGTSTTPQRNWNLEFMDCRSWENGIRKPLESRSKHIILLPCVSLSPLRNAVLPAMGSVKINYLTYTNYYECAPCNFLINQNASSFHLGQCTVFRGYGIHYTNTKTDKETFVFIPQKPYPEFWLGWSPQSLKSHRSQGKMPVALADLVHWRVCVHSRITGCDCRTHGNSTDGWIFYSGPQKFGRVRNTGRLSLMSY